MINSKTIFGFQFFQEGFVAIMVSPLLIYAKKDGLSNIYAQSILQDKQGRIWVGTGAGLFLFDGQRFRNFTKMDFEKL